jgi:uncharacterized protein YndB with AHSA1/START domain
VRPQRTTPNFKPLAAYRSNLRADWGAVECQVMVVKPHETLSSTWAAYRFENVVTWTLTLTTAETHLLMEQSGFPPDHEQPYQGARGGGQKFFAGLKRVVSVLS